RIVVHRKPRHPWVQDLPGPAIRADEVPSIHELLLLGGWRSSLPCISETGLELSRLRISCHGLLGFALGSCLVFTLWVFQIGVVHDRKPRWKDSPRESARAA